MSFVAELWKFLRVRKKYWLAPILIVLPSIMVTLEPIQVPSPMVTLLWIVVKGSTTTFFAIFAPGWI